MTSVIILAALLAQQPAPLEKCVLAGTAVDSLTGAPLGKVSIVAEHVSGNERAASTTTDAKGNFRLVEVDPGQYRISAKRNGYLNTYLGAKKSAEKGTTVTLTSGQMVEELRIKLTPNAVIAGTVRDSDGEPMVDVGVSVSKYINRKRQIQGWDSTTTNDLGEYRFTNLPAGRFYVFAKPAEVGNSVDHSVKSDRPREFQITTFYPSTADPAIASSIELVAGSRFTNADITLIRRPVYSIRLHVDAPAGQTANATLKHSTQGFDSVAEARSDKNGNVRFTGVPSGSYVLEFEASAEKPFDGTINFLEDPASCSRNSAPITVDQADIEGIRVAVRGCAEVTGRLSYEDQNAPQPPERIQYADFEPDEARNSTFIANDGTFHARVWAGQHTVWFPTVATAKLYVKSIRSGNQDVLRNGFVGSGTEKIELDVLLASDGGTVSGTVTAEDKPAAGAIVALIPNDPILRLRKDFIWHMTADQDGRFELKGVAPGDYKAFAWDDIEKDAWLDPDVLKDFGDKGEPVSVKAKDLGQPVRLHLIP